MPELDFVGEVDGEIIANIMCAKSKIARPDGDKLAILTFGPVSVKPEWHGRRFGAEIIRHSLDCARDLDYGAVIIVGHPQYYPRFGFKPANGYGLTMPDGGTFAAFMALELKRGYLGAAGGKWHADKVFEINITAFSEWNKVFQARRK
ncbi:MAG: N-acetyltransferase [Acidaminococcales bacterium]|nr:N-acetyltransferase [Acidaminococcales bacterium]